MGFFSPYLIRNERKSFKTSHTYFLMLETNINNSKITTISSFIELAIEGAIAIYFFSFKAIVMLHAKHQKVTNAHKIG